MKNFPEGVRRRAYQSLTKRRIDIVEKDYVSEIRNKQITTQSGNTYSVDLVFLAVGVKPSSVSKESDLPTGPEGGMRVNQYLQCLEYPNIFGGGDCIYFQNHPLNKVGVYAVRENPVLYHNLKAALEEAPLTAFEPGGEYLLIFNMGDGTGIFHRSGISFGGKLAFAIKNHIDRRFMRQFQAIER
jgi:NADH dehydrogenase FAD-containing subunit